MDVRASGCLSVYDEVAKHSGCQSPSPDGTQDGLQDPKTIQSTKAVQRMDGWMDGICMVIVKINQKSQHRNKNFRDKILST